MLSTAARRWQQFVLALAMVATTFSFGVNITRLVAGGPVAWTSWALPLLVLGNATLLWSGWWDTRRRVTTVLWTLSTAVAVAIVATVARTL